MAEIASALGLDGGVGAVLVWTAGEFEDGAGED